jgi:hypothetical protein
MSVPVLRHHLVSYVTTVQYYNYEVTQNAWYLLICGFGSLFHQVIVFSFSLKIWFNRDIINKGSTALLKISLANLLIFLIG